MKPERLAKIETFYRMGVVVAQANAMIGDLLGEQATDKIALKRAQREAEASDKRARDAEANFNAATNQVIEQLAAKDAVHAELIEEATLCTLALRAELDATSSALAKCEERWRNHKCDNAAVLNVTASPESRVEVEALRSDLRNHEATIRRLADENKTLRTEVTRERRELADALDHKQAAIDSLRKLHTRIDLISFDGDLCARIHADTVKELLDLCVLAPLTDDGRNLLEDNRRMRRELEAVETARAAEQQRALSPAPDVVRLQQALNEAEDKLTAAENRAANLEAEMSRLRGETPLPEPMA